MSIGTSVEIEGVVLPTGLTVDMFMPYNMFTDWQIGESVHM